MNELINQSIFLKSILKKELKRALKIKPGPCFPSRRILDPFINKEQMERGPELLEVSSLKQAQVSKELMPSLYFFFKDLIFLMWTCLKSLLNLLQYCFSFMFWVFSYKACGILARWPVIEPAPPVLEAAVAAAKSLQSDSVRPHGLQPTRLLRPWEFLGKSTRVGCHCLLRIHIYI